MESNTAMYRLTSLDAVHVSTVLEDAVDQLEILGKIISRGTTRDNSTSFGRGNSEQCLPTVNQGGIPRTHFGGTLSFSTLSSVTDSSLKIETDRSFLCNVLLATLNEVKQHQTFTSLVHAVDSEEQKKRELKQIIIKEDECRQRVKQLQRQLIEIKDTKETEIQRRNELIAHLKDQLQEAKAKTAMESKYIKKDSEVRVASTQKQCSKAEQTMKDELEAVRLQLDSESRVNAEIESFLRSNHLDLEQKVENWMEKYDKDVEAKQAELDTLKANRAQDLSKLQELTQKYNDYEKVVLEDRAEKEKARRRAERDLEELKACVKIQSWWRGVMVRRQLGPFSKKKKKGKKGKKSGKKTAKKGAKK